MLRNALVLVIASALMSCTSADAPPAGPTAEEDLAAIAVVRDAVIDALRNDDVAGIMAEVVSDHRTMAPGAPTVPGNDALEEWHQNRVDLFTFQTTFVTDDIRLAGDYAIERWSGPSTLTPRDGSDPVEDSSKGIWVWQRQDDGAWKLLWSIWNSDLPAGIDWNAGGGE